MSSEGSYPGRMSKFNMSRSSSLDDRLAANIAADTGKDEEAVARSGDSGVMDDSQGSDPWFSGEMEHMETKWLEQKLRHRVRSQDQAAFAGDMDTEQVQEGTSLRFGHGQSIERWGSWNSAPSFSRARSKRNSAPIFPRSRSLRFSRRSSIDAPILELRLTDYLEPSMVQPAGFGTEIGEQERTPDAADAASPLSDSALIPETDADTNALDVAVPSNEKEIKVDRCQHWLEYGCNLAHLAFFGMIGVGSFFMGWVGIVLKRDIAVFSEPLAVGLSTGLMGSITTFAGWNQKMVLLMTSGNVAAALAGFVIGMELAQISLVAGVDTAKAFKWAIAQIQEHRVKKGLGVLSRPSPDNFHRCMVSFAVFLCVGVFLWAMAVVLMIKSGSSQKRKILWLACIVAPPGVWARWHLARLNGQGFGTYLKWLPFGTLLANLIAASLEAVLATLLDVTVDDNAPMLIGGLQLGFLGCMSTVSTFVAEIYAMRAGPMKPKAYVYIFGTLLSAFVLGILFYSVPAWAKGYVKW